MVGRVVFLVAAVIAVSQPASADPASGLTIDEPLPQYLALGFGAGSVDGLAVSLQIGRQFHRQVDWFDEFDAVINDRGDVPTAQNETDLLLVTGARWRPFSRSPGELLQLAAVYLKAGIAFDVPRGLSSSLGLAFAAGYLPLQGRRWAVGAEARASTSKQTWTCMLVFELTN
jgi:hypothetical protein